MCVNYRPPTAELLRAVMEVMIHGEAQWKQETWKDYLAPIVLDQDGRRVGRIASYGIVPRRHIPPHIRPWDTMNARAETLGEKRSFASAWRNGQLCLVPMTAFYEPNYESGKSVRWEIGMHDGALFAVAGLWKHWTEEDGSVSTAFTQITINADEHPLMKRFHKPGDEKRSLVIVPPEEWDSWLACRDPEMARSFLRHHPPELMAAVAAPLAPRKKAADSIQLSML